MRLSHLNKIYLIQQGNSNTVNSQEFRQKNYVKAY